LSLILNIETSTTVCSVALAEDENLLALKEEDKGYTHAEKITLFIQDVFAQAGKKISDLDAVAVSNGPGSYTGLRIGASTAKGLCYALDKPLISVDTLKAMAYPACSSWLLSKANLVCPMIDARRMEVYCAVYDKSLNEVLPVSARVITSSSFEDLLKNHLIFFFGDGAAKCKPLLAHQSNASFLEDIFPSAKSMIPLSYRKFLNREFEDTALYEPFYLKEVVARKSL
jgi:tRNA threonylcarbamoyladenosine biosynthesis protein TsaB